MEITKQTLMYFSPTSTTRKVIEEISKGVGQTDVEIVDMTRPENREKPVCNIGDGLVIIGAPVYAGRVAPDAASAFKQVKASGNPAILVVLYGNREFEDALLELKDISIDAGLVPVAAAAFIGEHSFSSDKFPVAAGRPDTDDLKKAFELGEKVKQQLQNIDSLEGFTPVDVPGNSPYKEGMAAPGLKFIEVSDACVACGTCVEACPADAIDEDDNYNMIPGKCILCCACIKVCPSDARSMMEGPILDKAKWLLANCSERKEPVIFSA